LYLLIVIEILIYRKMKRFYFFSISLTTISLISFLIWSAFADTPEEKQIREETSNENGVYINDGVTEEPSEGPANSVPSGEETEVEKEEPSVQEGDHEGETRHRSKFPEHPELYLPMPLPDKTNKPSKPGKEEPEIPENHTIEN
jgi:hypothetical protein